MRDARGWGAEAKGTVLVFGHIVCPRFSSGLPAARAVGCRLTGAHETAAGHIPGAFCAGASRWGVDRLKGGC